MFSSSAAQVSTAANYIEDVFSTYLYTGNGATQTITNGINTSNTQDTSYILSGTYTFIVPSGITSIQAVAIGPGGGNGAASAAPGDGDGGGGGALIWATIPVTPGESLNVRVGASTLSNGSAGTSSYIYRGATRLIEANAGTTGFGETGSGGPGGTFLVNTSFISTYGGGNGGNGRAWQDGVGVGGGSAGTYTGNGAAGSGTANGTGSDIYGTTVPGGAGTAYGWGRKANDDVTQLGGGGAVRILWGAGRSFPSTNVTTITYSNQGSLVWIKGRSGATNHALYDTARGATFDLASNSTAAQTTETTGLTSFGGSGFTIGSLAKINTNAATYTSWTFRKQAKFFDVVTYTGNGTARTIAHNLGSVPGCIIVKRTDAVADWPVYHRGTGAGRFNWSTLNTTAAFSPESTIWNNTSPTSTVFSVGTATAVNANGGTYVAYLFAHDAGGFGAAGTDNVISCGSFTTDGSANATVSLGYEPQWLLIKSTGSDSWWMLDNMRGFFASPSTSTAYLAANTTSSENPWGSVMQPTATGFTTSGLTPSTAHIYIAIRRGPMKTPTSGTSVFSPVARTGTGATATVTTNFPVDLIMTMYRGGGLSSGVWDRLRGIGPYLETTGTQAEATATNSISSLPNTAYVLGTDSSTDRINRSGYTYANWVFGRAPGFFDVVCYTGNSTAGRTVNHNLGVAPELMIVKNRSGAYNWFVYSASLGATKFLALNLTNAGGTQTFWNDTTPTSSVFSLGGTIHTNGSGNNYVAYLFATVAGVSKVGSYTGSGTTKQIDCGFTGGARFVLIKRTDSTGDWYVWDSARGIVAGNDPYLLLNSTAAEVTGTDYVDTYAAGFEISSTAPAAINANGGTFIFLAIA